MTSRVKVGNRPQAVVVAANLQKSAENRPLGRHFVHVTDASSRLRKLFMNANLCEIEFVCAPRENCLESRETAWHLKLQENTTASLEKKKHESLRSSFTNKTLFSS